MSWMVRSKAEENVVFIVPSILARVGTYAHCESVRKLSSMPNPAVHVKAHRFKKIRKLYYMHIM